MNGCVAVTGAAGFVGRALVERLRSDGVPVRAIVRAGGRSAPSGVPTVSVPRIDGDTEWGGLLHGCDAIVHCAARAHVTRAGGPGRDRSRTHGT